MLNAYHVLVVIYPDAGEPVTDGRRQYRRDNVEKALMKVGPVRPSDGAANCGSRSLRFAGGTGVDRPSAIRRRQQASHLSAERSGYSGGWGQHGRQPDLTNPFPGKWTSRAANW